MNIVLFAHPLFMQSQSMPRFAKMLEQAYLERGHKVQVWSPQAKVYNFVPQGKFSKWVGYVDQYILFPLWVRKQIKQQTDDTLYVFADQAMGPWVPLVKKKPHVVHVHDLLALRSALGNIPENPTSWTGRLYQRYICHGFKQAKNFISVSKKTRDDLLFFGKVKPIVSEVVYNGLNYPYSPIPITEALNLLLQNNFPAEIKGMLLHISGNQWYKNVPGVIRIYAEYANKHAYPLPLWIVGCSKYKSLLEPVLNTVPPNGKVLFLTVVDNKLLNAAYSLSRAFIFPSLAEGFGWPIIEAQACGCPVVTTDMPPMNEIGGPAAKYVSLLKTGDDISDWADDAAIVLGDLLSLDDADRDELVKQGISWTKNFDSKIAIEAYLRIYHEALALQKTI